MEQERKIHRVDKNRNYSIISNAVLRDPRLSWKAKGILAHILTRPDDWKFYIEEIMSHSPKDGEASFRAGWKELKEAGYVERIPVREGQRIVSWETHIYENPLHVDFLDVENLPSGKPTDKETYSVGNPVLLSTDGLPSTDSTIPTTTTVGEIYTKIFGTLQMPALFSDYIIGLKGRGLSDEFIKEAMLEAGESSSGKPNLRFFESIAERWQREGIQSREQAAEKRKGGASGGRNQRPDAGSAEKNREAASRGEERFVGRPGNEPVDPGVAESFKDFR